MKYITIQNNVPINYSIEQLFQDYPNAVIYKKSQMPDEQLLLNYNVYPLITTAKPNGDVVTEGIPELVKKEWHQTWIIRSYTLKEKLQNQKELENRESQWLIDSAAAKERYSICQSCNNFNKLTTQCKKCGCFMPIKVRYSFFSCPMNNW